MDKKEIEIPFGAFDSELMHQEINIPEGFEAEIKGNKIILKKTESEDEKVRKEIMEYVKNTPVAPEGHIEQRVLSRWLAWLEKQGEQKQYDIDVLEKHITKDSISELAHTVIVRNGWEIVDAKEQNPVWSEEDEVMIKVFDSIIRYIVEVVDKDALERFGTNREELFSWLKSLRPQNNWKPSDEQMKQLGWIAEQNKDNMIGKELISLYQDLKKLREE